MMKLIQRIYKLSIDIIEMYLPIVMLAVLFVSFVAGVFFRYVMKNPQSWTYEISTICFLSFVILSACYVQREEKQIVFDMLYNNMNSRVRCLMRIFSNLLVSVTCIILTPVSVQYVKSMKNLTTQILKIPRGLVFFCFIILFASTAIRAGYRFIIECKAYLNKTYVCSYSDLEVDR